MISSLAHVPAVQWNACVDDNEPFTEHAFLYALETSRSVGERTGWLPQFVLVWQGQTLAGAVPLYLKDNSYGEYIFDWAWAQGAARGGIAYYPKLVAAVPFTPATGRRLLVHPSCERAPIVSALLDGVQKVAQTHDVSSVHFLFCTEGELRELNAVGYRSRLSYQFHWHNRSPQPYKNFDDFLSAFRSPSRKQVKKERRIAAGHGLRIGLREGGQMNEREWQAVGKLYDENADKHGAITYLTPAFFQALRDTFAHRIVTTFAYDGEQPVAGTLNFEKGTHIYGRYWGCEVEREMLHFELCYYQLIDRAIERGHCLFEAGAQGEHKLKRGLMPSFTHSAHLIVDPSLDRAIAGFLTHEQNVVKHHVQEYTRHAPYNRGDEVPLP
ncbi:MAG: GNAT family N-acetyltransferase [Deltaproteobacteria bacterium]|nr:GNAT family N-acetyltransferase [Deltaproteobacteria bacterium]